MNERSVLNDGPFRLQEFIRSKQKEWNVEEFFEYFVTKLKYQTAVPDEEVLNVLGQFIETGNYTLLEKLAPIKFPAVHCYEVTTIRDWAEHCAPYLKQIKNRHDKEMILGDYSLAENYRVYIVEGQKISGGVDPGIGILQFLVTPSHVCDLTEDAKLWLKGLRAIETQKNVV